MHCVSVGSETGVAELYEEVGVAEEFMRAARARARAVWQRRDVRSGGRAQGGGEAARGATLAPFGLQAKARGRLLGLFGSG